MEICICLFVFHQSHFCKNITAIVSKMISRICPPLTLYKLQNGERISKMFLVRWLNQSKINFSISCRLIFFKWETQSLVHLMIHVHMRYLGGICIKSWYLNEFYNTLYFIMFIGWVRSIEAYVGRAAGGLNTHHVCITILTEIQM